MSRKLIAIPFAALALIAAAPASSVALASNEQSASASQSGGSEGNGESKAERKICKTFANTASRMRGTRLCLTREEWKKFNAAQED